jgi:fluoride exporter
MTPSITPGEELPAPPPYLRPGPIALVVAGGAIGTAVRAWAGSAFPASPGGLPWATLVINVSGALLLGLLLESLTLIRSSATGSRAVRLALGTGLLGGYTTYSTFVIETLELSSQGHLATAVLYDATSLTAGFAAALAGMLALRSVSRRVRVRQ